MIAGLTFETGRSARNQFQLQQQFAIFTITVRGMYHAAAIVVLGIHLAFILWVIFGALFTRGRSVLRWFHFVSLGWGILIELVPWTCPLTFAENWLEGHAGLVPYTGGFLLHYLDALVYPNIPPSLLTIVALEQWDRQM